MRNSMITLLILHFVLLSFAQNTGYGIRQQRQTIKKGITDELKEICDINSDFPATWIKEYISVEVSTTFEGEVLKAKGINQYFTEEQRRILKMGETGSEIAVVVKYYPENNLKKELKELDFTYTIVPDIDAEYAGGEAAMQQYFKENAVDQAFEVTDIEVHKVVVSFVITKNGEVTKAKVSQNSRSAAVDKVVLDAIKNMDNWIPARNEDGKVVEQTLEFIITREMCSNRSLYVYE